MQIPKMGEESEDLTYCNNMILGQEEDDGNETKVVELFEQEEEATETEETEEDITETSHYDNEDTGGGGGAAAEEENFDDENISNDGDKGVERRQRQQQQDEAVAANHKTKKKKKKQITVSRSKDNSSESNSTKKKEANNDDDEKPRRRKAKKKKKKRSKEEKVYGSKEEEPDLERGLMDSNENELPPGMSFSNFPQASLPFRNDDDHNHDDHVLLTPEDAADEFLKQQQEQDDLIIMDEKGQQFHNHHHHPNGPLWHQEEDWEAYNDEDDGDGEEPPSTIPDDEETKTKRACHQTKCVLRLALGVLFVVVAAVGLYFIIGGLRSKNNNSNDKDKGGSTTMAPTPSTTSPPTTMNPTTAPTVLLWDSLGPELSSVVAVPNNGQQRPELGSSVALNANGTILASGAAFWNDDVDTIDDNDDIVDWFQWHNDSAGWLPRHHHDEPSDNVFGGGPTTVNHSVAATVCALDASGSVLVVGDWTYGGGGVVRTLLWDDDTKTYNASARPALNRGLAGDAFGFNLALSDDGTVLIVGAPGVDYGDGNKDNAGRVYGYDWNGQDYRPRQFVSGEQAGDEFGTAVALSADGVILAVGAPYYAGSNGAKPNMGSVQVFSWDGTQWNPMGAALLGLVSYQLFGTSVSLSADGWTVAVGAPQAEGGTGMVRIFRWDGLTWNRVSADLLGQGWGDGFGSSVALSRDATLLAVGAVEGGFTGSVTGSGHVQVFQAQPAEVEGGNDEEEYDLVEWIQVGQDLYGNHTHSEDNFGSSVALGGDILAVENGQGQVQTFRLTSTTPSA